ncbi:MAG: AMP-dependent synthetase/ligase [Candidatus Acidiferrales bacterium]
MADYPSVPKCFLDAVDRYANPRAQMHRGADGWQAVSAKEMLRRVAGLAKALAELGIRPGDRVGIFAPNCPEWHVADFAIQGIGAVTVPVYFHESPERLKYILSDSGARIAITAGAAQAEALAKCRKELPQLEQMICARAPAAIQSDILQYETFIGAASDEDVATYRQRAGEVTSDQLATIIYTSGTTGEPKGVMLSHANLTSNATDFSDDFNLSPADVALSLLPLAHVYERTIDYGHFFHGVSVAYVEQMETVAEALLEVRPTMVAAVPRFYEKIYANIMDTGRRAGGMREKIFDWALRVAAESVPWRAYGKRVSPRVRLQWHLADSVVYSKIRKGVGGRIRVFSAGGAPLAPELAEFFWSVHLPVYQGYGLTETSPVVTANSPKENKVGTVGRPIPHVQLKIAEDGEVLVKGPCVMQGYYRKPDETRAAFTADGWFCTGDIGQIDEQGFLIITDRKKEMLKTAGGKFVAPAPIENALKTSPYISNAIVVGDRRKFVSVLIVPNFPAIGSAARKTGREFASPAQMSSDAWVRGLLTAEMERLTAALAQYEKPKRFAIVEQDFTYGSGQLTYTLKLKRRVIEEQYRDVIERIYADVEEPKPHALG